MEVCTDRPKFIGLSQSIDPASTDHLHLYLNICQCAQGIKVNLGHIHPE